MKKQIIILALLVMSSSFLFSQTDRDLSEGALLDGKNIVKVNVTGLALRSFGFSAERVINRQLSAVVGVSFMPSGPVPGLKSLLPDSLFQKMNEGFTPDMLKISSFSLSPELRIYTGEGYGKGFYLSPFFKLQNFNINEISLNFKKNDGTADKIDLSAKINTYSAGLMIGYQWLIGKNKNFVIDWTILGANYGTNNINIAGKYSGTLTDKEKKDVEQVIDDNYGKIPFLVKSFTRNVTGNTAEIKSKGAWAFLRFGVSVGYRF